MSYFYLASPYSHPCAAVREARYKAACMAAGRMMRQGMRVLSPIAHSHSIAQYCELPTDWDWWQAQDTALLEHAAEVWVLMLPGWEYSRGVAAECGHQWERRRGVVYTNATDEEYQMCLDAEAAYERTRPKARTIHAWRFRCQRCGRRYAVTLGQLVECPACEWPYWEEDGVEYEPQCAAREVV